MSRRLVRLALRGALSIVVGATFTLAGAGVGAAFALRGTGAFAAAGGGHGGIHGHSPGYDTAVLVTGAACGVLVAVFLVAQMYRGRTMVGWFAAGSAVILPSASACYIWGLRPEVVLLSLALLALAAAYLAVERRAPPDFRPSS